MTFLFAGLVIIVLNLCALKSLGRISYRIPQGTGEILYAVTLFDCFNGFFCFIYFYDIFIGKLIDPRYKSLACN